MMGPSNQLSICCKSSEFYLRLTKRSDDEYQFSHAEHCFDISPHIPRSYDLYVLLQLYHVEDKFRDRTLLAETMQLVDQHKEAEDLIFRITEVQVSLSILMQEKPIQSIFRFFKISDLHIRLPTENIFPNIRLFDTFCVELCNRNYSVMEEVDNILFDGSVLHIFMRRPLIIDYGDADLILIVKAVNFADKSYASMMNYLQLRLANLTQLAENCESVVAVDVQLFECTDKFLRFSRITKFIDAHINEIEQEERLKAISCMNVLLSADRYLYYAEKMRMKAFISFYDDYALVIQGDYGLESHEFQFLEELYNKMCFTEIETPESDAIARVFFNITKTSEMSFATVEKTILEEIEATYQCQDAIILNPLCETDDQLEFIEFGYTGHDSPIEFDVFSKFQSIYVIDVCTNENKVVRVLLQEGVETHENPNENFFLALYQNPIIIPSVTLSCSIKLKVIDPIRKKPITEKELPERDIERLLLDGDDFLLEFMADEHQMDIGIKPGAFKRQSEKPFDPPGMTLIRQKTQEPKNVGKLDSPSPPAPILRDSVTSADLLTEKHIAQRQLKRNHSQGGKPAIQEPPQIGPDEEIPSTKPKPKVHESSSESEDLQIDPLLEAKIRQKMNRLIGAPPSDPSSMGNAGRNDPQNMHFRRVMPRTQSHDEFILQNRKIAIRLPDYSSVPSKTDNRGPPLLLKRNLSKIIDKPLQIVGVSKIADYFHGKTNVVPGHEEAGQSVHDKQKHILNALGVRKRQFSIAHIIEEDERSKQ